MPFQNFFATKLYTDIGANDSEITLEKAPTVTSGRLVLEARNPTKREIIKFTGVSGNQLTGVTRGQGGTSATDHTKGSLVEMNVTAEDLSDALDVPNDIVTRFDETLGDFVSSGLTWSQSSLLVGSMTAGIIYINGYRVSVSATSYTFPASKDTYVDVNVAGTLAYTPVANNAAAPALAADSIRLAKVVTNATAITSVVQSGIDSIGNPFKPTGAIGASNMSWSTFATTWKDVKAQRSPNTDYTNTHPYPIQVSVSFDFASDSNSSRWRQGSIYVDGVRASTMYTDDLGRSIMSCTATVPPGATYNISPISSNAGKTTIYSWTELS